KVIENGLLAHAQRGTHEERVCNHCSRQAARVRPLAWVEETPPDSDGGRSEAVGARRRGCGENAMRPGRRAMAAMFGRRRASVLRQFVRAAVLLGALVFSFPVSADAAG